MAALRADGCVHAGQKQIISVSPELLAVFAIIEAVACNPDGKDDAGGVCAEIVYRADGDISSLAGVFVDRLN